MAMVKTLLMGYNGANNTGAEALLLADLNDFATVLGEQALITVPTLNEQNLRRYVREGPHVRIAHLPTVFFLALWQLVRQNDLVVLVEGSTYMDTWTPALLWAYLWATHCAHSMGKLSLAYAVDAGTLNPFDEDLVRREASHTDLIVTRSVGAAQRLKGWGVTAPIEVTADNALTFEPDPADADLLRRLWPESSAGVAGICPVDPYQWPVVIRPWGPSEDRYKWPYYFSHSSQRTALSDKLAADYAAVADSLIERGKVVALLPMEQLDERFARHIQRHMAHQASARIFSARDFNASQMTSFLRALDLLITGRYHASVLSLAAHVPQIAVGHDLRLTSLYQELDLGAFFVDAGADDLRDKIQARVESLLSMPQGEQDELRKGFKEHLARAQHNRELLRAFVHDHGLDGGP